MPRELLHASLDVIGGTFIETEQFIYLDNSIYWFRSYYIYALDTTASHEIITPKNIGKTDVKESNEYPSNYSLSCQFLLSISSCEFYFFTESLQKLLELDNMPFCSAARSWVHFHMICFVRVWDNGSVHPYFPSSHMYSIFDKHLKEIC